MTISLERTEPAVHARLDALASIADHPGTGYGTPQGMGVTRYLGGPHLGPSHRQRGALPSRAAVGR